MGKEGSPARRTRVAGEALQDRRDGVATVAEGDDWTPCKT